MTQRIVLVSGCIRGPLWSELRRRDMSAIRTALRRLSTDKKATFVVPYFLYGEVSEQVGVIRQEGELYRRSIPHTEVVAIGTEICPGMCAELQRAIDAGLPIRAETTQMKGHLAGLRIKRAFRAILRPAA